MKKLTSYYPVVCTYSGEALMHFFCDNLGFETVFQSEWYWHLSMKQQPGVNIAFVQPDHPSVPKAYRQPVQGMILNIEMEQIDDYYQSNEHLNWELALPLRSEDWGQRHFIIKTPEPGLLIDFIEVIPVGEQYADNYLTPS